MEDKHQIRKKMLTLRSGIPPDVRRAACGYVCEKLLSIPLVDGEVVAAYYSMRSEIDVSEAVNALLLHKNRVCMPVVTEAEMILKFLELTADSTLKNGAHGTREPAGGEVVVPATVWVPLLAFDRRGNRLGYGGGYYDATLAFLKKTNPSLRCIGVGYSLQETDALPVEPHDMTLDMIVTEKEIIQP